MKPIETHEKKMSDLEEELRLLEVQIRIARGGTE